jgi:VWFA-related protein
MSLSAMFKIKEIQDAAIEFVKQLKPQDRIMVVSFDEKIHVLSEATTDRDKVVKAIRKTDFDDGTSLYNAVSFVIKKKLDKIEGRKAIVLFTDGVDTTSYKTDALGSLRDAEESGATVFPVAYSTYDDVQERLKTEEDPEDEEILGTTRAEYEEGERYLNDLTARTGGKLYRADSTVNLGAAFAGIAEELRRQYSIGYYPVEPGQIGQRRQIKVNVSRPNTIVRARENYIVGENQMPKNASEKNVKARKEKSRN